MREQKRRGILFALLFFFACMFGFGPGMLGAVRTNAEDSCLITIENGAAEANTQEAVNGLHVYDPESEELDDLFSGAELPAGKTVSVYVYNLASPVHLTITHNGEVLADRYYQKLTAWEDDDKVEFFDITLEGDLQVVTEVATEEDLTREPAEEEPAEEKPVRTLHVTGGELCGLTLGGENAADGAELPGGSLDLAAARTNQDVYVKFQAGNRYGFVWLSEGYPAYTFSQVDLEKDDVHVTVQAAVRSAEAEKKTEERVQAESGRKETAAETGDGFTVSIDNRTGSDTLMTVGYVDDSSGTPVAVEMVSGNRYAKGLMVGARAVNRSSRQLRLTAYNAGGGVVNSVIVPAMNGTEEGAGGFYVDLNESLRFVLEYIGEAAPQGGEEQKTPDPAPETGDGTPVITIDNGAASANTDTAVNAVHVYDTGDGDMPDLASGAKKSKGSVIELFVYNLASPVHLTVVHNGVTIKDVDYPKREAWVDDDKIEFIRVTLEGDLTVTTRAIAEGETAPEPETKPEQKEDPEPETTYLVTVEDKTDDTVTTTVGWIDMSGDAPKNVDIVSGSRYPEGLMIGGRVLNDSEKTVIWSVYEGGALKESGEVESGGAGGCYVESLAADALFVFEFKKAQEEKTAEEEPVVEEPAEYTISIQNGAAEASTDTQVNAIHVYDLGDTPDLPDLEDGAKKPEGTELELYVYNLATPVHLIVKHAGETIKDVVYPVREAWSDDDNLEYINLTLAGDVEIVTEAVTEEAVVPLLHIQGEKQGTVYSGLGDLSYEDGAELEKGVQDFLVYGNEDVKVRLTVRQGETEIFQAEIEAGYNTVSVEQVDVTEDLYFVFEEIKEEEETPSFTLTIEDRVGDPNAMLNLFRMDAEHNVVALSSGDQVPGNEMIMTQVVNYTEEALTVTAYAGDKVLSQSVITPEDEYGGLDPITPEADILIVLEKGTGKTEPESFTITVENKAAEANTDYAVNGLHVYDPDEAEMPDINGSVKKPAGTKIEIYAYNKATPIRLTILHKGEEIKNVVYPILASDDQIDWISLTLEGDLVVTAETAKPEEVEGTVPVLHIQGENVGWVYNAESYNDYADGAQIAAGIYSFEIYGSDKADTQITVKKGEAILHQETLAQGYQSFTLTDVEVDQDIYIIYETLS